MSDRTIGVFEVELPDTLEERLVQARRVRGWSQTQLAEACRSVGMQIRQDGISDIEQGKRRANALQRAVFAHVLNVPASYFFITEESNPGLSRLEWEELSGLIRDILWYDETCLSPAGTAA